jgi:hypothetical protein
MGGSWRRHESDCVKGLLFGNRGDEGSLQIFWGYLTAKNN